jgi:hypothetical protein
MRLKLFHHFIVDTSQTLYTCLTAKVAGIFQTVVSNLALQNDALLNLIYSLAALHLAFSGDPLAGMDGSTASQSRHLELCCCLLGSLGS